MNYELRENMKTALEKTWRSAKMALPIVAGVLMLVSLLNPLLQAYYPRIFTGNYLVDPIIGALAGSISLGIPLISYTLGGELLKEGVSLLAVTAFLFAWSAVGIMMLPLEIAALGRRFAIWRNALNFVASLFIAVLVVLILRIL